MRSKFLLYTLFLIISLVVFAKSLFAQSMDSIRYRKNAVYVEGLGNIGTFYSINYERKLYEHKHGFFTARIGFLYYQDKDIYRTANLYSTALVNHIFSKGKHHFEIGGGIRLVAGNYNYTNGHFNHLNNLEWDRYKCVPTANILYRYQKPGGRFIFRIGWTPLFYQWYEVGDFAYLFYCGASAGFTF